jgi:hypothetical protein
VHEDEIGRECEPNKGESELKKQVTFKLDGKTIKKMDANEHESYDKSSGANPSDGDEMLYCFAATTNQLSYEEAMASDTAEAYETALQDHYDMLMDYDS